MSVPGYAQVFLGYFDGKSAECGVKTVPKSGPHEKARRAKLLAAI